MILYILVLDLGEIGAEHLPASAVLSMIEMLTEKKRPHGVTSKGSGLQLMYLPSNTFSHTPAQ